MTIFKSNLMQIASAVVKYKSMLENCNTLYDLKKVSGYKRRIINQLCARKEFEDAHEILNIYNSRANYLLEHMFEKVK